VQLLAQQPALRRAHVVLRRLRTPSHLWHNNDTTLQSASYLLLDAH
jgi:hypothetical protein